MDKYCKHFLMDTEEAKIYSKDVVKYFAPDEKLEAKEIGDGNINYVFKIWNPETGKSLIIKQADTLLRSSGRPLDVRHSRIEAEILKIQGQLAPTYIPKVHHYDEIMCAISMEDISEYKNLRKELMDGKTFSHLAEELSTFLADTLLPTTDLVVGIAEKKDRVIEFTNKELCDISEDLVFTEPYYNYKNRNIIIDENKEFVEEHLYNNEKLKAEVGMLRNNFMNCAQSLIHGDLHSGSIFANEKGIKVIDPEFAFYGPMGYDIGNVIGNLFFSWTNKFYTDNKNEEFLNWIEKTIENTVDLLINKLSKKYDSVVTFDLYNKYFKENYLKEVLADSMGYAGTEMIRRVVGDSKVIEVTSVEDMKQRLPLERALIKMGIALITDRYKITMGKDLTERFNLILA